MNWTSNALLQDDGQSARAASLECKPHLMDLEQNHNALHAVMSLLARSRGGRGGAGGGGGGGGITRCITKPCDQPKSARGAIS